MTEFRSGNGTVWLDLLSTLAGRYRGVLDDALGSPELLGEWLDANGLGPAAPATDDDLDLARTVREALHRVTLAAMRGDRPAAADVSTLRGALAEDGPPSLRATDDGLALGPPRTVREALGRLVRDAVVLLSGDEVRHLHACGDDTCSSVFLDRTGRRRWCTDLSCGNRSRVRAHRAKSRTDS